MPQCGSSLIPAYRLAAAAGLAFGCAALFAIAVLSVDVLIGDLYLDMTKEVHYSDYQAVMEDKAVVRGWVPPMLPPLAQRVWIRYDLDFNWIRGSFEFAPGTWDPDKLKAGWELQPLDYEAAAFPKNGLPRWWPESFPQDSVRYYHYGEARYDGSGIYFAVDSKNGRAWYWHTPEYKPACTPENVRIL